MNWLTTELPVSPVISSALFASTPRSETCWSDFSQLAFFMMFSSWSLLVCFLVLAAEWWIDSDQKYYKKLYRCRQTFLSPVHMNKWIHEIKSVLVFFLYWHMDVTGSKSQNLLRFKVKLSRKDIFNNLYIYKDV